MCFQVYMCPGSSVLVLIPLKIYVELLRIVLTPFPSAIKCKEVEGCYG